MSKRSRFKDRSRRIARERYWREHDRDSYQCPDCGRTEEETHNGFEVHHEGGDPYDNRFENLVALCHVCHCLREDRKPPIEAIRAIRNDVEKNRRGEVPSEVREFIENCIGQNPKRDNWVNPFGLYWSEFEKKYPKSEASCTDLATGLEELAEADVVYEEHEASNGIAVYGVEWCP